MDLPPSLEAPFYEVSGKAIWYSLGTLVCNAASIVLGVDPGELQVGVRGVRRGADRLHGEPFLYDNVPGGAGYARAIHRDLKEIVRKALDLASHCDNPQCAGACYQCLFDYRNQYLHPILDRGLGKAILEYVLEGAMPRLTPDELERAVSSLSEYARASYEVGPEARIGNALLSPVLADKQGTKIGVWPIHPLSGRPTAEERASVLARTGLRCAVHTTFDLERRPLWVLNNLVS